MRLVERGNRIISPGGHLLFYELHNDRLTKSFLDNRQEIQSRFEARATEDYAKVTTVISG